MSSNNRRTLGEIFDAVRRLRDGQAKDGAAPRAPTSPKTKTWKPGTPKGQQKS